MLCKVMIGRDWPSQQVPRVSYSKFIRGGVVFLGRINFHKVASPDPLKCHTFVIWRHEPKDTDIIHPQHGFHRPTTMPLCWFFSCVSMSPAVPAPHTNIFFNFA